MISEREYIVIHNWMGENYGRASKCEGQTCTKKSTTFDWALKANFEYAKNRDAFMELCRKCHAKYDREFDNLNRHDKGFVLIRVKEETRKKLNILAAQQDKSVWEVLDTITQ